MDPFKEPTAQELDLKRLNELETYLEANPNADLEKVKAEAHYLVGEMNFEENFLRTQDSDLIVPPFFWGCVLSLLGVLLVYVITDQDKEATKKALFGCLAGGLAIGILYVLVVLVAIGGVYGVGI